MSTDRRCGTCCYWERIGDCTPKRGNCVAPIPASFRYVEGIETMREDGGRRCGAWRTSPIDAGQPQDIVDSQQQPTANSGTHPLQHPCG